MPKYQPPDEMMPARADDPVTILYTNWRGETAVRRIVPGLSDGRRILLTQPFWFGESDWHKGANGRPEPQWFLRATDADPEQREHRDFAMAGIKAWGQAAVDAALTSRADGARAAAGRLVPPSVRKGLDDLLDLTPAEWEMVRECDPALVAKFKAALSPIPMPGQAVEVPDSLRALSEAASEIWDTNEATPYILGPQIDGETDRFEVIARGPHGHAERADDILKWRANRMFAVAAVNFVRTLLHCGSAGRPSRSLKPENGRDSSFVKERCTMA